VSGLVPFVAINPSFANPDHGSCTTDGPQITTSPSVISVFSVAI